MGVKMAVRMLRKHLLPSLMQEEAALHEDLHAYYAPRECYELAHRGFDVGASRRFEQYGVSLPEALELLEVFGEAEHPFANTDCGIPCMPPACEDACYLGSLLEEVAT